MDQSVLQTVALGAPTLISRPPFEISNQTGQRRYGADQRVDGQRGNQSVAFRSLGADAAHLWSGRRTAEPLDAQRGELGATARGSADAAGIKDFADPWKKSSWSCAPARTAERDADPASAGAEGSARFEDVRHMLSAAQYVALLGAAVLDSRHWWILDEPSDALDKQGVVQPSKNIWPGIANAAASWSVPRTTR
ncbi:hypothetical protein ACXX9E_28810 [Pseudomonas sp. GNP014]